MSSSETDSRSRPATTASQASRQSAPQASGSGSRGGGSAAAPQAAGSVIMEGQSVDLLTRGGTIYTGPDGQRPHRMRVDPEYTFVGEGDRSVENTSAVAYLFRGAKDTPFPRAKSGHIGEIGWSAKRGTST